MPRKTEDRSVGGIKGFFTKAFGSLQTLGAQGGQMGMAGGMWAFKTAGTWGFYIATTAMVTFMPLLFEIGRERQVSWGCCLGLLKEIKLILVFCFSNWKQSDRSQKILGAKVMVTGNCKSWDFLRRRYISPVLPP